MSRSPGRPRRFACPPSGEKVLQALDDANRPLDPRELQEAAHIPRRTLYHALACLSRLGLVRSGTVLHDTRRSVYVLAPERRGGAWRPCFQTGACA